ncbi:MAG: hypothetical protein OXF73_03645 [Gammaproteobacteria bacterium]|nr:hypothetical protein [Gammaproteobacteria bacterium]
MPDDKAGEVIPYEELTLKQQLPVIEMADQKVEKSESRELKSDLKSEIGSVKAELK